MTRVRIRRIAQPAVGVGRLARAAPELVDELVVLARKDVVEEAQPDGPVVRERRRIPGPPSPGSSDPSPAAAADSPAVAVGRLAPANRTISSRAGSCGIALHAFAGQRRRSRRSASRPTRRCCCCGTSSARAHSSSCRPTTNVAGRPRVRHVATFPWRQPGGSPGGPRPPACSGVSTPLTFCEAQPTAHVLGAVVALLEMREPVVGHELDPERRQHVEERRLLVVAVASFENPGLP